MEHQDIERRLDKLEARMDQGFNELRDDINSLFRNGPLSRLSERVTVAETQLCEHLKETGRIKVWIYGIAGTILATGATWAVAQLVGR